MNEELIGNLGPLAQLAGSTLPKYTAFTSLPDTPLLLIASEIAKTAKSGAGTEEKAPLKIPIGVRTALYIYMKSPFALFFVRPSQLEQVCCFGVVIGSHSPYIFHNLRGPAFFPIKA